MTSLYFAAGRLPFGASGRSSTRATWRSRALFRSGRSYLLAIYNGNGPCLFPLLRGSYCCVVMGSYWPKTRPPAVFAEL